jgi:hypothetical protein
VTDRPEYTQRFAATLEIIRLDELTLTQIAKYLDIGYATLKRLMDCQFPLSQSKDKILPPIANDSSRNAYAEVL